MAGKTILYVEDEETDVFLMRLAWKRAHLDVPLKTVTDGERALDYLRGRGDFANREEHPVPGLVLLDLNLPRIHGLEVLEWIRGQADFKAMPVVIYSSSEQSSDMDAARDLGANDYIVKPHSIDKIAETAKQLIQRWLG